MVMAGRKACASAAPHEAGVSQLQPSSLSVCPHGVRVPVGLTSQVPLFELEYGQNLVEPGE